MLEEEQGNKNIFIRKIEQYLQEMSELSKVISSIRVKISLDNMMIIIMPVYFIYLKHQNQDLLKRTNRTVIFWLEQSLEVLWRNILLCCHKYEGVLISP